MIPSKGIPSKGIPHGNKVVKQTKKPVEPVVEAVVEEVIEKPKKTRKAKAAEE